MLIFTDEQKSANRIFSIMKITGANFISVLPVVLIGALLSGCWGGDCQLQQSNNRKLNVVDTFSLYQDTTHPEDTVVGAEPYSASFMVVHLEGQVNGHPVDTAEPGGIFMTFTSRYSGSSMQRWKTQGLFVDTSADSSVYGTGIFLHLIALKQYSLTEGTYPFDFKDTTGPVSASVRLFLVGAGDGASSSLAVKSFTGSITITKAFKTNSGKFSYMAEVEYLTGQKTQFSGTVSHDGYVTEDACGSGQYPTQ
jgi:hypothetical protein